MKMEMQKQQPIELVMQVDPGSGQPTLSILSVAHFSYPIWAGTHQAIFAPENKHN